MTVIHLPNSSLRTSTKKVFVISEMFPVCRPSSLAAMTILPNSFKTFIALLGVRGVYGVDNVHDLILP